ncbi:MAG TPA: paraslipin [Rhodospirillaceae bacterium]|nr:MAG: paraslipin [Alphaproteobacteria bacterium GWF2_58_20]HAU28700.1 paraslipin [Rhodospirillaceae bacterium]
MEGFSLFPLALLVVVFILIAKGVKTVPQGQQWTVERFGRYTKTISPGLTLIIPVVDRIGHKISMKETMVDVPSQQVITRDNAMVTADAIVFFQIVDAAAAAYEVNNVVGSIANLATTNLRTVIGSLELDEVLSQRDQMNVKLLHVVDLATNPWGVKVTRIEIRDISPPTDITNSMARQMKAEREKRAEILTAEGEKQAAILRSEGMKQSSILEAEGKREAAFREAEARERAAEAEAKATQMVSDAIAQGNVNALNYFVAQKYVEALKSLASAPNQKVLMLPVDAMGVMGSLAGIAELAKSAMASNSQASASVSAKKG